MLDVKKELERMAKEFGLTEKEVAASWRNTVRHAWSKSIFRQKFYLKHAVKVKNTNPRSKKRFPVVTKYKCAICEEMFTGGEIEIDYKLSENKMTDLSHAGDFIENIFFTSPDLIQILCKDKKKKVKGKFQVERFGCHSVKTYQERYGVSFKEALVNKKAIDIAKCDKRMVDALKELGVSTTDLPKTKKAKKELLTKIMKEI